jgi:GMP synthase-like glutamine amidotransferase
MTKMTMIEALKKLEELNDYNEILVITNAGEPQLIENAIEDIQRNAEDPEEVFDLRVTEETIRELDEEGYIKTGDPLYAVVRDPEPLYHDFRHEFRIVGIEAREFTVRSGSQTSARINVPAEWIGKKVMLVRLE